MKDKRNCNNNYPVYPQPFMTPPMYPNYYPVQNISANTYEQQLNNLEQQINILDKRVTRLENLNNLSNNNLNNKYNDSNYYMV